MSFKGLFGPNEEIKGAHLEDSNNRVMPSFGPDDRPVLAEQPPKTQMDTKKGSICVLPLPLQRYNPKWQNANQLRKNQTPGLSEKLPNGAWVRYRSLQALMVLGYNGQIH